MFYKFQHYLLSLLFTSLPFVARAESATPTGNKAGFGLEETAKAGGLITDINNPPAIGPAAVAGGIVGYLLAFVGVIFFVLMIYGGFLWMTARGAEEQIKKAQELIKSAIIGIVIIGLSYVITRFVLTSLTDII